MPKPVLVLVRHAFPEIDPGVPANQWRLSAVGRERCILLAARLAPYAPDVLASSVEPKALETAEIVGARLGKAVQTVEGLHEHDRRGVGFFESRAAFEAAVARFFASPGELVFGAETADQAHARFVAAVNGVVAQHEGASAAIFTHGTVMTLFVARAAGLEPLPFWRRLGLPGFVALSLPELDLLAVVENVTETS